MSRRQLLDVEELRTLEDWGVLVGQAFGEWPYQVGSTVNGSDTYRDVDVRVMLDDEKYDSLMNLISVDRLNYLLTLWGKKATGLRIDCQIQRTSDANAEFDGVRMALGIRPELQAGVSIFAGVPQEGCCA